MPSRGTLKGPRGNEATFLDNYTYGVCVGWQLVWL
jgi:hypothetical protein